MNTPKEPSAQERLTPAAWQKFGNEWCLTGQFGMRPIFLSTNKRSGFRLLKDGFLVPFTPDHPHAQRMVDAWNSFDESNKLLKSHAEVLAEIAALREDFTESRRSLIENAAARIKELEDELRAVQRALGGGVRYESIERLFTK